jgi:hypothetical protein
MEGKREGKKTLYQLNIQAKENHHTVERALSAAQVASLFYGINVLATSTTRLS